MRGPLIALLLALPAAARQVPHAQDRPPGPPLSPAEAVARMTVPPGFAVEVVAAEPDLVNPVAMTFDERGRVYVAESLEYPRKSPGPGRDRIKVLEDTDGDGRADKFTVFAEGLNIPSGVAVGHGGVWVVNSPDLLFLRDTDGDGRADKTEVVLTGFGRDDTHELPNSLTWGPDGWLYGWNGVFNPSHVEYKGETFDFTCAIFRINPRTRAFQVWCQGTSNPWGIAFNDDGDAFASACVIDHFWHLTESGYYHRQGGPYPPYTWKLESVVDFAHQKAAYCGVHYLDTPAYPAQYRGLFVMGNIHGNCLNVDTVVKSGATYRAVKQDDFLSAHDAWFMPVSQKTGPDGCLYVLDWYDRYHCYQDANRDPAGIDRLKGRLYRVNYKNTPRRVGFDLAKLGDAELMNLLRSGNIYDRETARRLLSERGTAAAPKLAALALDAEAPARQRREALWALIGTGAIPLEAHRKLLGDADPVLRKWAARAVGDLGRVDPAVRSTMLKLAADPDPAVRLQVAIAAPKFDEADPMPALLEVLSRAGEDILTPPIVWQNLQPRLDAGARAFLDASAKYGDSPAVAAIYPRVVERLLARRSPDAGPVAELVGRLVDSRRDDLAAQALATMAAKIQGGEVVGAKAANLRAALGPILSKIIAAKAGGDLAVNATLLAASWREPAGLEAARGMLSTSNLAEPPRLAALAALIAAGDPATLPAVAALLPDPRAGTAEFRGKLLAALGRLEGPEVAASVLRIYPALEPGLQPKAVELLTQRPAWSKLLLAAVAGKSIPSSALNVNQVRKLLASKDADIVSQVKSTWGTLREDRNPAREQVVNRMRAALRRAPGDPVKGQAAFTKLCAQCHKIYGEGQEVGPDITANGRASYDQLLSNVFDPNLVIGAAYQATTVATADGRILSGLVAEDGPQRLVLKLQGGKTETIARADVEESKLSPLSLMPEGLEDQLTMPEWADLFAFLMLDKPPTDPTARRLPGLSMTPRSTTDPRKYAAIVEEFAPGFAIRNLGEEMLAILPTHRGRDGVLKTHPMDERTPCVLSGEFTLPPGKSSRLILEVSHDDEGDWGLVVKVDGRELLQKAVGPATTNEGWAEYSVDLTPWAGKSAKIELLNQASGWSYEYGYWGRVEVESR